MASPVEPADSELVASALTGDRAAFAAIYDRYADRLYDFCVSVLRDRDDAADAVQDTFLVVAERLDQLRDPQRLRPWLYAVARSVALRRIRDRKRYAPQADVVEQVDTGPAPPQAAEQAALRELVWSAAAGLSDRDRALLDLHLRHGLDGAELGEAMSVSAGHAYVLLNRLRDQLQRSLGALLIARLGRRDCVELAAMLNSWDGRLSPLVRKRIARHVDKCDACSERRRRAVSPVALLATIPLIPAPVLLRERVLRRVELVAYHGPTGSPGSGPARPPGSRQVRPPGSRQVRSLGLRRRHVLAAGTVLLVVVAGAGAGVWAATGDRTSPELVGGAGPSPSSTPGVPSSVAPSTSGPAVAVPLVPPTSGPGVAVPLVPPTSGPAVAVPLVPPTSGPGVAVPLVPPASDPRDGITSTPPPTPPVPRITTSVAPPPVTPADTVGPVIVGLDISPSGVGLRGCATDRASVYAEVTDDSGINSVALSWTDPGGRTGMVEMPPAAGSWRGTLGPFTQRGRVRWRVVATDEAGNTTIGPPRDLTVTSCTTPPPTPARVR